MHPTYQDHLRIKWTGITSRRLRGVPFRTISISCISKSTLKSFYFMECPAVSRQCFSISSILAAVTKMINDVQGHLRNHCTLGFIVLINRKIVCSR